MNLLYLVSDLENIDKSLASKINELMYYSDIKIEGLTQAKEGIRKQLDELKNSEDFKEQRKDYYGDVEDAAIVRDLKKLVDKRIGERMRGVNERIEEITRDIDERMAQLRGGEWNE